MTIDASPTYRCKRGETLVIALEAVGASDEDVATVSDIHADLKPCIGTATPSACVPAAASFTITSRSATDAIGAGWNLTLSAGQTQALATGTYATDAKLVLDDGSAVEITEPLFIKIEQAVTA